MSLNKVTNNDGTSLRIGEVRFSYPKFFEPDPESGKYSCCIIIDKGNTEAIGLINKAIAAAAKKGAEKFWSGKIPANLKKPLRDGDEEKTDDEAYFNSYFFNCSNKYAPQVVVKTADLGLVAADEREVYPGCYGAVTVSFFPYNNNGNRGVGVSLGNVIKLRDGERLAGTAESAEASFADLAD